MSEQLAQTFIAALRRLEDAKDAGPIAALYAADAALGNVLRPDRFHGLDGAREFWTEYRGTFDQVRSEFRNVIAGENTAALEWTTTGTSFDGKPVQYTGVTILETQGDAITRSCAYFDPSVLGSQVA